MIKIPPKNPRSSEMMNIAAANIHGVLGQSLDVVAVPVSAVVVVVVDSEAAVKVKYEVL